MNTTNGGWVGGPRLDDSGEGDLRWARGFGRFGGVGGLGGWVVG